MAIHKYAVRLETQDEPGTDFDLGPFDSAFEAACFGAEMTKRYGRDPDFTVVIPVEKAASGTSGWPDAMGPPTNEIIAYMDEFYGYDEPQDIAIGRDTNAARAAWAKMAFNAVEHDDNPQLVQMYDLICNLLHLADTMEDVEGQTGLVETNGQYVARMALWHYGEELVEEAS
jgi:hypothetical protein